jgi:YesN/AraC family two-component response regulator
MKYVLCVDDDQSILNSLQQQLIDLQDEGIICEVAFSGTDAIELIDFIESEGDEVAILITDQMMPTMTGTELISKLKITHNEMSFVLLTGYTEFEEGTFDNLDFVTIIEKPWDHNELIELIRLAC